jgi:hypothetical protein
MSKYIQNITPHKANIQIVYNDPSGGSGLGGQPKKLTINFRPERINTMENRVEETGFTAVDDATYESLLRDRSFIYAVEEKWLMVHDDLPESAQSPTDALQIAHRENAALRAKVEELEAKLAEKGGGKKLKEEFETAMAEKTALVRKLEESGTELANVQQQLEDATVIIGEGVEREMALAKQVKELNEKLAAAAPKTE